MLFRSYGKNNGSVVEWSMALVLKTRDCNRSVSSNLTASANIDRCESWSNRPPWKGVRPYLGTRVRIPFLLPLDRHRKRLYNNRMYKVVWKDTAGRGCEEEVKDLSEAMAFAKELGILVTINGDNFELVGIFGADEVKDGLLPNGDSYTWYKRRRP